jgi:alcohol dehydrogenase class IV
LIVMDDVLFKLGVVEEVRKALSDDKIPFAIYIQIPSLKELGVDKEKLNQLAPKMAEDAIASGSPGNNPRQATKEEIIEVYKIAYSQ